MTDDIRLDPLAAARAGSRLPAAGGQMLHLRETSGGRIEQANLATPWGNDKLGESFEKMSDDAATRYPDVASLILGVWTAAAEQSTQIGGDMLTERHQQAGAVNQRAAEGWFPHRRLRECIGGPRGLGAAGARTGTVA